MRMKNGKCSWSTILSLVLMVIVVALLIFIAVTYSKQLQCRDDDDNSTESSKLISFLLFSDVHLDPFYKSVAAAGKNSFCRNESKPSTYNATYGRIGCDSPLELLHQLLNAMKQKASSLSNLDFLMLSGDTCAHGITTNRRQEALKIMDTSSKAVQLAFPNKPYFPSIGNNDLPGHYVMPTENDTWYSDLLTIWEDAILCKNCSMSYQTTTADELRKTFLYGGYYRVSIAGGKMTLLVLNSMYWTMLTWKPYDYFQERAMNQMKWLEDQLELAKSKDKKVLITSHISPGIDSYNGKVLWLSNFTEMYMDLVTNKFSDVVAGQIYAHFHKDSFRFLQANKKDLSFKNSSYIILMPSLSVVYKNNPNYRIVYLDPDLRAVKDYEQWYMNLVMATGSKEPIFPCALHRTINTDNVGPNDNYHVRPLYDLKRELKIKCNRTAKNFVSVEFRNPVWQLDYKFSSRYPPNGSDDQVINGKRIKHLSANLINQYDDSFFTGFISSRQVRYQPDPYSRLKYYCAVTYYRQEDFDACQKKYLVPGG